MAQPRKRFGTHKNRLQAIASTVARFDCYRLSRSMAGRGSSSNARFSPRPSAWFLAKDFDVLFGGAVLIEGLPDRCVIDPTSPFGNGDGRRRHALPGPWLEHQIAEVEWGAAEINATFGNYGGAASMPADVDSLAGIAAPRVT